jgi:hypothetical protein
MTKPLKASGFLGLATMMTVGLYQFILLSGGQGVPGWLVGGHAHLGVISILAIVVGFAVPSLEVTGRLRTAVTVLFIAGQWGIPGVIWIGEGAGFTVLLPTVFLWGGALIASMLILLYKTVTQPSDLAGSGPTGASAADE